MFDKLNPAHLRLAAYVAAVIYGAYLVFTGAVAADSLPDVVGETDAQLGAVLAIIGGMAGRYVDRSGEPEPVIAVDAAEVAAELAPDIVDAVKARVEGAAAGGAERGDEGDLLGQMRRRIEESR